MSIRPIKASLVASLENFTQKPLEMLQACGADVLAVLESNEPVFYVLSPQVWHGNQAGLALVNNTPIAVPTPVPVSFDELARQLLVREQKRVEQQDLSAASLGIMRNRLDAHVLPFFRAFEPSEINAQVLENFVERLQKAGLSTTTVSQYLVVVRKLLRLAIRQGSLRQMPEWPAVRVINRPRSMLTLLEYASVVRTAQRLARAQTPAPRFKEKDGQRDRFWVLPRHMQLAPDMAWAIRFMVNGFLRPGDLRQLKHRHVQICRQGERVYLRLSLPETKRHDGVVVSMHAAVRVYENLCAHETHMGLQGPDDYVFLPKEKDREYALAVMGYWFKWVMREAGLATHDNWGRPRTLYGLRHTAIMFRLLYGQGIDMLTLARNARTSVQMIERFYASALDGEMNVGLLHSRRKIR